MMEPHISSMALVNVSGLVLVDNSIERVDKYVCPKCNHLLKDAVQTSCGHWLCHGCAEELFSQCSHPICPRLDCGDELTSDDGKPFFPDKYVRKEIRKFSVKCPNHKEGCTWSSTYSELVKHIAECLYEVKPCPHCGSNVPIAEFDDHLYDCPKFFISCPFKSFGCKSNEEFTRRDLEKHITGDGLVQHLLLIAEHGGGKVGPKKDAVQNHSCGHHGCMKKECLSPTCPHPDCGEPLANDGKLFDGQPKCPFTEMLYRSMEQSPAQEELQEWEKYLSESQMLPHYLKFSESLKQYHANRTAPEQQSDKKIPDSSWSQYSLQSMGDDSSQLAMTDVKLCLSQGDTNSLLHNVGIKYELDQLRSLLMQKDTIIRNLEGKITCLEATIQSKTTENEDRDFCLSLMENSNYDGTMRWKIPQFSQRMEDARTGKYTSIFSLPFNSGRYGYKTCLRLYILGDGIGKGTHMSLFFVVMKGEFDNILQWPFTHKVTFKLINQCGGRDVVDIFQPDPLSSSFQKPKTDMNVASGCPRFISLSELMQGGFIVDDTVFIKVKVDTTNTAPS